MTFLGRGFADQTPLIPASRQYRERRARLEAARLGFSETALELRDHLLCCGSWRARKNDLLTCRVCQASNLRARRRRLLTGGTRQSMTNHPARNAKYYRE